MGVINFIGLLAFVYMFVEGAAPIQFFKKLIGIHNDSTPVNLFLQVCQKLFNCAMCFGFWVGFFYYLWVGVDNIIGIACIVSLSAEIFQRLINFVFNNLLPIKWKL